MYTVKVYWPEYSEPSYPQVCRTTQFEKLEDAENEVYRYQSRCRYYRCTIENKHGDMLVFDTKGGQTFYKNHDRKESENTEKTGEKEHE